MFCMRNKKIIFLLHTLNLSPVMSETSLQADLGSCCPIIRIYLYIDNTCFKFEISNVVFIFIFWSPEKFKRA